MKRRMQIPPRDLAFAGIFGAAGLLLPLLFHVFHLGIFLMPMYLPIMALAFLVEPPAAIITALVVPMLSNVLTGMPPMFPPVAPIISLEISCMVVCVSVARKLRPQMSTEIILGIVLLIGRAINIGLVYAMARVLKLPAEFLAGASFIAGWPGLILMMIVIPPLVRISVRGSRLG